MYYCSNCGSELDDDAMFCPNCGVSIDNDNISDQNAYYFDPYETKKGSKKFAIISLVCGILSIPCSMGICIGALLPVAAILLGLISFKKQENAFEMAIAGIICGGVGLLISFVVLIIHIVQTIR